MKHLTTNAINKQYEDLSAEFDRIINADNYGGWAQFRSEIVPFMQFVYNHLGQRDTIRFMEIGLLLGKNFTFIGNCLGFLGKDVYGIGVDNKSRQLKERKLSLSELIEIYSSRFIYGIIDGNSHDEKTKQEVEKLLNGQKLDLLFIDGSHTYGGCNKDYEMYSTFVRPGGIIAFDDIEYRDEVGKVWQERKNKRAKEFSIMFGRKGIGAIVYEG